METTSWCNGGSDKSKVTVSDTHTSFRAHKSPMEKTRERERERLRVESAGSKERGAGGKQRAGRRVVDGDARATLARWQ
jgi:hypothetical protein